MVLSLTNDGESAAYVHMGIDDPSDDDGERGGVLPEEQIVPDNEDAERGVATSAYCRRYRQMRPFGCKWAEEEYEWVRGSITSYNLGWLSGYAQRRASFSREPEIQVGETHLYLGETWIYEGGSA